MLKEKKCLNISHSDAGLLQGNSLTPRNLAWALPEPAVGVFPTGQKLGSCQNQGSFDWITKGYFLFLAGRVAVGELSEEAKLVQGAKICVGWQGLSSSHPTQVYFSWFCELIIPTCKLPFGARYESWPRPSDPKPVVDRQHWFAITGFRFTALGKVLAQRDFSYQALF